MKGEPVFYTQMRNLHTCILEEDDENPFSDPKYVAKLEDILTDRGLEHSIASGAPLVGTAELWVSNRNQRRDLLDLITIHEYNSRVLADRNNERLLWISLLRREVLAVCSNHPI